MPTPVIRPPISILLLLLYMGTSLSLIVYMYTFYLLHR